MAFQYSVTSCVVRRACFGKCNSDFHWKCKRSVFTENATTYSVRPKRKCKQKTNDLLCQSCFSSTCWICNEQVPFLWVICFLCCQQKQTTAAATARWKANADDALAILRVRGHQNVLLTHAMHHDTFTHRNVAERVCAVCYIFTACILMSNLLMWIFQI